MTDAQLADFLGVPASFVATINAEKRATYDRMAEVDAEITLWQAGLGPAPVGVILCGPNQIRRAGR